MNALQETEKLLCGVEAQKGLKIRELVKRLYDSRLSWIEAALSWSELRKGESQGNDVFTPDEIDRSRAFEILTIIKNEAGHKTTAEMVDKIAENLRAMSYLRIRSAGVFWAFHLSFIRAAVEVGRPRLSIIEKIDDLSEAISGDRRP